MLIGFVVGVSVFRGSRGGQPPPPCEAASRRRLSPAATTPDGRNITGTMLARYRYESQSATRSQSTTSRHSPPSKEHACLTRTPPCKLGSPPIPSDSP